MNSNATWLYQQCLKSIKEKNAPIDALELGKSALRIIQAASISDGEWEGGSKIQAQIKLFEISKDPTFCYAVLDRSMNLYHDKDLTEESLAVVAQESSAKTVAGTTTEQNKTIRIPPPTVPTAQPIHIQMMDTILRHRLEQLERLSHQSAYLEGFAKKLCSFYCDVGSSSKMEGQYAEYLLQSNNGNKFKAEEVACHYIALMYRSVDERLSKKQRLHAVKSVRVASRLLRDVLERMERGESLDGLGLDYFDGCNNTKKRRAERTDEMAKKKSRGDNDDDQMIGSAALEDLGEARAVDMSDVQGVADSTDCGSNMQDDVYDLAQITSSGSGVSASVEGTKHSFQPENAANASDDKETSDMSESVESTKKSTASLSTAQATNEQAVANTQEMSRGDEPLANDRQEMPSSDMSVSAGSNEKSASAASTFAPDKSATVDNSATNGPEASNTQRKTAATAKATNQSEPSPNCERSYSPEVQSTSQSAQPTKSAITNIQATDSIEDKSNESAEDATGPKERRTTSKQPSLSRIEKPSQTAADIAAPSHSVNEASLDKKNHANNKMQPSQSTESEVTNIQATDSIEDKSNESTKNANGSKEGWTTLIFAASKRPLISSGGEKLSQTAADTTTASHSIDEAALEKKSHVNIEMTNTASVQPLDAQKSDSIWCPSPTTVPKPSIENHADKGDKLAKPTFHRDDDRTTLGAATESQGVPTIQAGAKTSISSGAASAFEPINSSQRTAASGQPIGRSETPAQNKESSPISTLQEKNVHISEGAPAENQQTDVQSSGEDKHDIVDLITPPGSPRPPSPPKEVANSAKSHAPKAPTPVVKQLPPSPPPVTKVILAPPTPFPEPRPFSQTREVAFLADNTRPFASGSLHARATNKYTYNSGYYLDGSGACLEHKIHLDVQERLSTWDPYWRIIGDVGLRSVKASSTGQTWVGTRTAACAPKENLETTSSSVSSCAVLPLNLQSASKDLFAGVKWGQAATPGVIGTKDQYKTGDTRLLLRTMPLFRSAKDQKKRADTHLWPKGTMVQLSSGGSLNDDKIVQIIQRRQEKHDESSWKGMSHVLDLTRYANPHQAMTVKLCSAEVVENADEDVLAGSPASHCLTGSYSLYAAICRYVAPDDLYDQLMGRKSGGDIQIPTLSERSAKILAMEYVSNQTVLIDDSDDEDSGDAAADESNSLTFSLICPLTKAPMETPVRGRNCKHLQCFDLRNYLQLNEKVAGGRWKCINCEEFVSVRDLIHCGLFQAMLDHFRGQISAVRDKVTLHSDGTFHLNAENKLRYASKKPAAASKAEEEVIDLD